MSLRSWYVNSSTLTAEVFAVRNTLPTTSQVAGGVPVGDLLHPTKADSPNPTFYVSK